MRERSGSVSNAAISTGCTGHRSLGSSLARVRPLFCTASALMRYGTDPLGKIAVTVTLLTITSFLFLVYLAGFFANSLLAVVEHRRAASSGLFDGELSRLLPLGG